MISRRFKVNVDCGQVLAKLGKKPSEHHILLSPGLYKLTLKVSNCWVSGGTKNHGFLEVKEPMYLNISDYYIRSNKLFKKGCGINTGGDGQFSVQVKIDKLNKKQWSKISDIEEERLQKAKIFFKNNKYNKVNSQKFIKLFLKNFHNSKISNILEGQSLKEMKENNKKLDKLLKQLGLRF